MLCLKSHHSSMSLSKEQEYSMRTKNILSRFFDQIAKEINGLTDSDIRKLESGEFSISLKIVKKNSTTNGSAVLSDQQISNINEKLKHCNDREAGKLILIEHLKNRKELEAFAKNIDVFVMKQDKIDKLREKIIEGTIGAALRSSAIQGSKT